MARYTLFTPLFRPFPRLFTPPFLRPLFAPPFHAIHFRPLLDGAAFLAASLNGPPAPVGVSEETVPLVVPSVLIIVVFLGYLIERCARSLARSLSHTHTHARARLARGPLGLLHSRRALLCACIAVCQMRMRRGSDSRQTSSLSVSDHHSH